MFLIRIIRWILGYVLIEVNGDFGERFLNLLSKKQINTWNVKRRGINKITLMMGVGDFKSIKDVSKRSDCSVHILNKYGLPFIFFKHRKRKLFLIGAVCFLALLYVMSLFIWSIELVNADFMDKKVLIESLEKEGLRPGVMPKDINLTTIKNNIMIKHQEISWISINIKGTKAYVELRQRAIATDKISKDVPCNIVSKYDAVITKLEVFSGSPSTILGGAVKKGQLLVSGVVDSQVEGLRTVHAMANIEGKVWIEKSADVKNYEIIKVYTNRNTEKNAVKILGFRINLFVNSSIPYEKYDKLISENVLKLGNNIVFPIEFVTAHFDEYKEQQKPIDETRAKELAQKICDDSFNSEFSQQNIINKETTFVKTNDGYHIKTIYECNLPLGQEEKMP